MGFFASNQFNFSNLNRKPWGKPARIYPTLSWNLHISFVVGHLFYFFETSVNYSWSSQLPKDDGPFFICLHDMSFSFISRVWTFIFNGGIFRWFLQETICFSWHYCLCHNNSISFDIKQSEYEDSWKSVEETSFNNYSYNFIFYRTLFFP